MSYVFLSNLYKYFQFKSTLSKNALCQIWSKLSSDGTEEFLNFVKVFRYFFIISPWKKTCSSFEKIYFPFTKDRQTAKLTDRRMDRSEKFIWTFSAVEPKIWLQCTSLFANWLIRDHQKLIKINFKTLPKNFASPSIL